MTPIEYIRTEILGLTQAEMAELAGVNQATVSRWESGRLSIDRDAMSKVRDRARDVEGWSDGLFFDVPQSDEGAAA